jgi:hypothetical protein
VAIDTDAVTRQVTRRHTETLEPLAGHADAVVDRWDGASTTDPSTITDGLQHSIRETSLAVDLVDILETAVSVTDHTLAADPIPAPPYLHQRESAAVHGGRESRPRSPSVPRVYA